MTVKSICVIVSSHLIWQWAEKFEKFINKFRVYVYFENFWDSTRSFLIESISVLQQNHQIFDENKKQMWVVVLTTYQTLIQQNESSKHKSWLQSEDKSAQKIKKRDQYVIISWKHYLSELFDTVVLNEVHVLRNLNN